MKKNELLKIIIMKILKTTSLKSDFKFKVKKKEEKGRNRRISSSKVQTKSSNSFGSKKASNSLVVQMYSQENEVLFI
jgi:hypothetical protein